MWLQFLIALIWIVGCALARIYASRGYGNRNDMWGWTCKASWHQHTVKVPFAQLCGQLSVAYYVAVSRRSPALQATYGYMKLIGRLVVVYEHIHRNLLHPYIFLKRLFY